MGHTRDAVDAPWWQTFFDEEYLALWSGLFPRERCEAEAEALWQLLDLAPGARILDAPCGYGRVSVPLAQRGARVLGVDFSPAMIGRAAELRDAEDLGDRLELVRADLREPLEEGGFDAAINLFSSLGYGTEDDDRAVLGTISGALRRGGRLLVETAHRDVVVARQSRGAQPGSRLPDGTLLVEEAHFDPLAGRIETTWRWSGPAGSGEKSASLRVYSPTELVAMLAGCGFAVISAHRGVSSEPFTGEGPEGGGRIGLLVERL